MKIRKLSIAGPLIIELEKHEDSRGFFARMYCKENFNEFGIDNDIVQINNSFNKDVGTLRGMHYQCNPMAEEKIVRCISGKLYDVIVDIREKSASFGQWLGVELSSENRHMLYIPKGFAHGFITLEKNTELIYMVTQYYSPEHERGLRWNDPKFEINWPLDPRSISEKDANHPLFVSGNL